MERKKSWIRPFIMITLSHAEKRALTPQNVISRITGLFSCSSIVVATEKHQVGGFHFHATDAGIVEAWAVYYGMKLALEAFFYRIDVETDSVGAVLQQDPSLALDTL